MTLRVFLVIALICVSSLHNLYFIAAKNHSRRCSTQMRLDGTSSSAPHQLGDSGGDPDISPPSHTTATPHTLGVQTVCASAVPSSSST